MDSCISCSMPLINPADIGAKTADGSACIHCSNPDGTIKSCEEVFEGGVQFFMDSIPGTERALAERLTRKNMNNLPYWQKNGTDILQGEEATDEEFQEMMGRM